MLPADALGGKPTFCLPASSDCQHSFLSLVFIFVCLFCLITPISAFFFYISFSNRFPGWKSSFVFVLSRHLLWDLGPTWITQDDLLSRSLALHLQRPFHSNKVTFMGPWDLHHDISFGSHYLTYQPTTLSVFVIICFGLNLPFSSHLPQSYVGVLTLSTSECDFIWK